MDEHVMEIVARATEALEGANNALGEISRTLKEMEWNQRTK